VRLTGPGLAAPLGTLTSRWLVCGAAGRIWTLSNVEVAVTPLLCDVRARPANTLGAMRMVTVVPTCTQGPWVPPPVSRA
jgi:hypothetical protein